MRTKPPAKTDGSMSFSRKQVDKWGYSGVTVMPIEPQAAIMADEAGVKVVRIGA